MLEEEYIGRRLYEEDYEREHNIGMRIGMCEGRVGTFRRVSRKYGKERVMSLLELDEATYEELKMFDEKYKGLTVEKMAEHIMAESEFLIGV